MLGTVHGEVVLNILPVDHVIRVGEPVNYSLDIVNTGQAVASGVFVPTIEGFARLQLRIYDPFRERAYTYFIDEAVDLVDYSEVQLQPGERKTGVLCVLYNMPADWFVFVNTGQYNLMFSLAGMTASATVTVLGWDEEKDAQSIEASKLWMKKDIAYVYQLRRGNLSPARMEDLKRLTTEYGDTVYAKWAAELLQRIERPPAVEDTAPRTLKTISGSNLEPRRLQTLGRLGMIERRMHMDGRLSIEQVQQSIQWAEEYLEAEGDRLSPENRAYVEDYLEIFKQMRDARPTGE